MKLKQIAATYAGRCTKCSKDHAEGTAIYYDALGPRGSRAYCLACGGPLATEAPVSDPTAELAALKRKLREMETEKAETPKPVMQTVNTDPLAQAIAKAVEPLIVGKVDESKVRDIAARMIADYMTPPVGTIEVKLPDGQVIDMGRQHKQFAELLQVCSARLANGNRLNVWITGAAGTGKTSAAHAVATALNLEFSATGSLTDCYKLFGFVKPSDGEPIITAFRERWTNGGVFLLDDFDGSDPAACVEANHPFANGFYTFPDGANVKRHPDCILIITANTWGHGATNEYVGRFKQDAAFLDRFVGIDWEIDEQLERDTCPVPAWAKRVQDVRARVRAKGLKVLVTPRASYFGAALLQTGMPQARVEAMTLRKAMTAEQWSSVQ